MYILFQGILKDRVIIIKYIFKFMKKYRVQAVLGPLFKLFEASLELLVPIVVAYIIDNGINTETPTGNTGIIIKYSAVLVLLAAVGLAFSVTAQYFSARAAVGCASKMRCCLFDKLQSLSFSQIDGIGTSAMITRMTSDINQVQTGINLVLRLLLRSPFVVFGAMIMAFTVNVRAAVIFAVIIPILLVIVLGLMVITIPMYRRIQAKLDGIIGITRENLSGVRVIRSFYREDAEIAEFDRQNALLNKFQKFVGAISAVMNPVTYIVINIGIIVLIKSGAVMINTGSLTSGELVALYNYMSQILVELVKFASLIITVTKSIASLSRVSAVLDTETESDAGYSFDNDGSVVFENVTLKYDRAGDTALENIDFSIKSGEKIGIIGGTGSGKTSVVNLIPAFYKATSGRVIVGGTSTSEWNADALRKKIGIVPQKAVLFKGTIKENLLWGNENATDEQLFDAIETAQAADVIKSKRGGINEMLEQDGRNLSGGQKQRLTIARALVRRPKILILDDSASALDYATDANLRKALHKLSGMTVIIVSQRASSIIDCDKILVLDDGRPVGFGTHDELLKNCDVYKEIYYSQYEKEDAHE